MKVCSKDSRAFDRGLMSPKKSKWLVNRFFIWLDMENISELKSLMFPRSKWNWNKTEGGLKKVLSLASSKNSFLDQKPQYIVYFWNLFLRTNFGNSFVLKMLSHEQDVQGLVCYRRFQWDIRYSENELWSWGMFFKLCFSEFFIVEISSQKLKNYRSQFFCCRGSRLTLGEPVFSPCWMCLPFGKITNTSTCWSTPYWRPGGVVRSTRVFSRTLQKLVQSSYEHYCINNNF